MSYTQTTPALLYTRHNNVPLQGTDVPEQSTLHYSAQVSKTVFTINPML